ncbi:hypothetical protein GIB67_025488 [Kingdonia uniflora]|uniref:Protein IQ-DOMAIN 1 n=1 Tax=Kingdonia uniflora TaxID=39325 RepID=A0A7J7PCG9_9MAGN|nr:hypothetical protein GIB67_025488 [Kingdonia uniflora]
MGSGDWFKTIISTKKVKEDRPKQTKEPSSSEKSNGFKWRYRSHKVSGNGASSRKHAVYDLPNEDVAATRIQTVFRGYMARKSLQRLKGIVRFKALTQRHDVKKQTATTLSYIHSWSKIQTQIRTRRQCMVTEGRIRQKKLENQLKLEAKLHEIEVEWCGGAETMEEILGRIQQREEASVKRERAMAYAFSHQWKANSNQGRVAYEVGKENWGWGWSWMERWIAARPWESRLPARSISPKKVQTRPTTKTPTKHPGTKLSPSKPNLPNGNGTTKVKVVSLSPSTILETKTMQEKTVS